MPRYVTEHRSLSAERDYLTVITIFEEAAGRKVIRESVPFTRRQMLLVSRSGKYEVVS
ncbi:hypothetical protein JMA_22430 [Jeotgalibacillus malaysiensis]|uniref:Uncharacterized protein n=1 Tax=Jeotgalibacillus malaysiensis TaxID=1508404 RepID=A0A0B5AMN2_9BACL|nr:hypothetical protein [Jeotgalibacillus malaysiensis]AJD91560.1 hypothetical protein JMA_22430 [Jeotgalibacillus malaysiensis]